MGVINVAELKPDMVLAEDLLNPEGRFLLAKGTKLDSKHLRVMKMWGVVEANVVGLSQNEVDTRKTARLDPDIIKEAKRSVIERFVHNNIGYPPVSTLVKLCILSKAKEIANNGDAKTQKIQTTVDGGIPPDAKLNTAPKTIDPEKLIKTDIDLPSLPTIYGEINEVIHNPTSSANDIGNVISKDTSLSASLLRIVNSTFYGFPSKIDTLSRAVTILGIKQLKTLVIGVSIMNVFKNIPSALIDMKSFWEHSITCGIIARVIAGHKKIQNTERLFVAGLLHDIGRLVLYRHAPAQAKNALLMAKNSGDLLWRLEDRVIGCNHGTVGGLLLRRWKLPVSLENIITHHHAPDESKDPLEPAIVHLADIMTNALHMGSSGERLVPPLDPEAWESLDVSTNILNMTIIQTERQKEEVTRHLVV
jgi:putative nucleotidyltransferase with HDIG domain